MKPWIIRAGIAIALLSPLSVIAQQSAQINYPPPLPSFICPNGVKPCQQPPRSRPTIIRPIQCKDTPRPARPLLLDSRHAGAGY